MKPNENIALLIIDMQKGSFTEKSPRLNTAQVIQHINQLSALFRSYHQPVIFIQHNGAGTGEFEKYHHDWEIIDELVLQQDDIIIDKYANDAFYHSDLQDRLTALQTNKLYITGCATDFCVEATIQSALCKDFAVVVVADAHTTANRPHISAQQAIDHYNWVWQNMIPTRGSIEVKNCQTVINNITNNLQNFGRPAPIA